MVKKYKLFSVVALFAMTFLLVACQSKSSEQTTEKPTEQTSEQTTVDKDESTAGSVKEVLAKLQDAKDDLKSVLVSHQITTTIDDNDLLLGINGEFIFENQKTVKADVTLDTLSDEITKTEQYVYDASESNPLYSEITEDGDTKTSYSSNNIDSVVMPNYFVIADQIVSLEKDFQLIENQSTYELTLKNQDISLSNQFKEQHHIKLNGITEKDLEKDLFIVIDKETNFIQDFNLLMTYDGDKGVQEFDINISYSDWNTIDESLISLP
ncbi:hypothetical protein [Streptococcus zalophi]|uniref:hypothetical protein n=1 Tax=Streptococcus zalophi TaxID=640031 RepID=UPI00215C28E7|nr:hypothetical protein [Streptococcus zalophi]MCR8967586.1 hypothetical protein [Streptococcus zalophi]